MDLMRCVCLAMVLIASTAHAAVDAVIQGPAEAYVGDLVVLNSGGSVGDNTMWVVDPALTGKTIECADTLAFAVGQPGRYEFTLVAADKEANIAVDRIVVTVRAQGSPTPPVDPPGPVDPPPGPPAPVPTPDVAKFVTLSRDRSVAIADNVTALALADALKAAILASGSKPLAEARSTIAAAFEEVMLDRKGPSRDKPWLQEWRRPIDQAIDAAAPSTTAAYLAIMGAIEQGLRPQPAAQSVAKVVMYSRPGCVWCDRWLSLVMPALRKSGWEIETVPELSKPVPTFEICAYGRCATHDGYLDLNTFARIVDLLKSGT